MSKRPIDVEVDGLHVRLKVGQITFHSENYSSESGARRAADGFIRAVNTSPMRLIVWKGVEGAKERVVTEVRRVWESASGRTVVLPVDGGPDQARPPYFDPALESE